MDADDDELWRRHCDGDRQAWIALVRRYHGPIRRFFVNKTNRDSDDLAQATFQRIEEAKSRYEGRSTLRSYFYGVARNVLREHVRKRTRDEVIDLDNVTAQALDPRPSSLLCERAEQRLVLEGLRRLSLSHQIVLELFYWEDLTDVEIGEILEISHNTVRSRISRARDSLRDAIAAIRSADEPLPSTSANLDAWAAAVKPDLDRS